MIRKSLALCTVLYIGCSFLIVWLNLIQESNTDSGIDESYIQPEYDFGNLLDDSQNSQTLDLLGLSLNIDTKSIKTMAIGILKKLIW